MLTYRPRPFDPRKRTFDRQTCTSANTLTQTNRWELARRLFRAIIPQAKYQKVPDLSDRGGKAASHARVAGSAWEPGTMKGRCIEGMGPSIASMSPGLMGRGTMADIAVLLPNKREREHAQLKRQINLHALAFLELEQQISDLAVVADLLEEKYLTSQEDRDESKAQDMTAFLVNEIVSRCRALNDECIAVRERKGMYGGGLF
jgi:hypothetical protein